MNQEETDRVAFLAKINKIRDEVSRKDLPAVNRTAARKSHSVLIKKMKWKLPKKDDTTEDFEPNELDEAIKEVKTLLASKK